jgi:hypothetical protein
MTKSKKGIACLSGNALKIFALVAMTFDHIGVHLFPFTLWLRVVGRLSFPIFAYMIAEGATYTKNRVRYLSLMSAFAVVIQIVLYIAVGSLYMSIFFAFSLSLCLILSLDLAIERKTWPSITLAVLVWLAVAFVSGVLPELNTGTDFFVDYGPVGVLIPAVLYYLKGKWKKLLALALLLAPLAMYALLPVQWYAYLALIPLALYNGKRGKYKLKYFFYLYYPLHLAVIYGISMLI